MAPRSPLLGDLIIADMLAESSMLRLAPPLLLFVHFALAAKLHAPRGHLVEIQLLGAVEAEPTREPYLVPLFCCFSSYSSCASSIL